jgi:hypothetical protein
MASEFNIFFSILLLNKPILKNILSIKEISKIVIFFLLVNLLDIKLKVAVPFSKNRLTFLTSEDITEVDSSIIVDIPPMSLSKEKTENIF